MRREWESVGGREDSEVRHDARQADRTTFFGEQAIDADSGQG